MEDPDAPAFTPRQLLIAAAVFLVLSLATPFVSTGAYNWKTKEMVYTSYFHIRLLSTIGQDYKYLLEAWADPKEAKYIPEFTWWLIQHVIEVITWLLMLTGVPLAKALAQRRVVRVICMVLAAMTAYAVLRNGLRSSLSSPFIGWYCHVAALGCYLTALVRMPWRAVGKKKLSEE